MNHPNSMSRLESLLSKKKGFSFIQIHFKKKMG